MPHLITPITIPLLTGYDEHFTRPAGDLDTDNIVIVTNDMQSCCSFYEAAPKLGKPLYSETGQEGSCLTDLWYPHEIFTGTLLVGWALFGHDTNSCSGPTTPIKGAVSIGVCCATSITLQLSGFLSHWYDDVDSLRITLNGAEVYFHASSVAEGDALVGPVPPPPPPPDHPDYYAHYVYGYGETITIPLSTEPCGDILVFEADSVTSRKHPDWNGGVVPYVPDRNSGWEVRVLSIT